MSETLTSPVKKFPRKDCIRLTMHRDDRFRSGDSQWMSFRMEHSQGFKPVRNLVENTDAKQKLVQRFS